jgi:hypothetical protein
MPGNVPGFRPLTFFLGRSVSRRRGRRGHFGEDLIESASRTLGLLLLRRIFPVEKRVLGMAGLANDLYDFAIQEAGNRVVEKEPATRTEVINQITQALSRCNHKHTPKRTKAGHSKDKAL